MTEEAPRMDEDVQKAYRIELTHYNPKPEAEMTTVLFVGTVVYQIIGVLNRRGVDAARIDSEMLPKKWSVSIIVASDDPSSMRSFTAEVEDLLQCPHRICTLEELPAERT